MIDNTLADQIPNLETREVGWLDVLLLPFLWKSFLEAFESSCLDGSGAITLVCLK